MLLSDKSDSFKYHETRTTITSWDKKVLSAVFTRPVVPPVKAALLISGCGVCGPEGNVSSLFIGEPTPGKSGNLNEQLARYLSEKGVASLRFAKRGWDDQTEFVNHTLENLFEDVRSAFRRLKEEFPALPVSVIGFSEGSILAAQLAVKEEMDSLILLSPPARSIDEILEYQFIGWPMKLLKTLDHDGHLTVADFKRSEVKKLPVVSVNVSCFPWSAEQSSLDDFEFIYRGFFEDTKKLLQKPGLIVWYESLKRSASFKEIAKCVKVPVSVFYAEQDSQVNPDWIKCDLNAFPNLYRVRSLPDLGHCFSRYLGLGIKTSGPFHGNLLEEIEKALI